MRVTPGAFCVGFRTWKGSTLHSQRDLVVSTGNCELLRNILHDWLIEACVDSEFENPTKEERLQYAQYWQNKLKDNKDIDFPDSLAEEVVELTDNFSFAFLKECL